MILIHGESGYRKNFTQRTFLWYNKIRFMQSVGFLTKRI